MRPWRHGQRREKECAWADWPLIRTGETTTVAFCGDEAVEETTANEGGSLTRARGVEVEAGLGAAVAGAMLNRSREGSICRGLLRGSRRQRSMKKAREDEVDNRRESKIASGDVERGGKKLLGQTEY